MSQDIKKRLEYLRQELRAEKISTSELIELQSLAEHIEEGDVELLEAAGVPEFPEDEEEEKLEIVSDLVVPVKENKDPSSFYLQMSMICQDFEDEELGVKGNYTIGTSVILKLDDGRQFKVDMNDVLNAMLSHAVDTK